MGTHAAQHRQPLPLEAALAVLPTLPRPVLSRLVTRMIEHLDEQDGDPDLEDDDPAGGNVEDEGELASDGEDRGTGGYITYDEWREIKRLGRLARRRAKR